MKLKIAYNCETDVSSRSFHWLKQLLPRIHVTGLHQTNILLRYVNVEQVNLSVNGSGVPFGVQHNVTVRNFPVLTKKTSTIKFIHSLPISIRK